MDSLAFVYLKLGDTVQAKAHYTRAVEAYLVTARPVLAEAGTDTARLGAAGAVDGDGVLPPFQRVPGPPPTEVFFATPWTTATCRS